MRYFCNTLWVYFLYFVFVYFLFWLNSRWKWFAIRRFELWPDLSSILYLYLHLYFVFVYLLFWLKSRWKWFSIRRVWVVTRFIQHWCGEWNAPGEKASNRELHHTRTIQYILYTYCMYTVDTWISNMRKQKEWLVLRPGEKHPSSSEWSQQHHPAHNSWSHKHTCMMHKAMHHACMLMRSAVVCWVLFIHARCIRHGERWEGGF